MMIIYSIVKTICVSTSTNATFVFLSQNDQNCLMLITYLKLLYFRVVKNYLRLFTLKCRDVTLECLEPITS